MADHFASHSIILCGEHDGGEGGDVECCLTLNIPDDEVFATTQSCIAEARGCRLRFCAGALAGVYEEREG